MNENNISYEELKEKEFIVDCDGVSEDCYECPDFLNCPFWEYLHNK